MSSNVIHWDESLHLSELDFAHLSCQVAVMGFVHSDANMGLVLLRVLTHSRLERIKLYSVLSSRSITLTFLVDVGEVPCMYFTYVSVFSYVLRHKHELR